MDKRLITSGPLFRLARLVLPQSLLPASLMLLGSGLSGLAAFARRRNKK